jgi:hypothetical protein
MALLARGLCGLKGGRAVSNLRALHRLPAKDDSQGRSFMVSVNG